MVDGIPFPSLKEGRRYADLVMLERAGEIFNLKRQVNYPLIVNGHKICSYRADFTYIDKKGRLVVEDCKGVKTPVYILKKNLMLGLLGIAVLET